MENKIIRIKNVLSVAAILAVATLAQPSSASAQEGSPSSDSNASSTSIVEEKYKIQSGDSLSKVAEKYDTTWEKLWKSNPYIVNPNLIYVGDELVVGSAPAPVTPKPAAVVCDEATQWVRADNGQCLDKPVEQQAAPATVSTPVTPRPVAPKPAPKPVVKPAPKRVSAPVRSSNFGGGNTYTPGQCTWHVKNMRGGSLPNGLGDANEWYRNAKSMGLSAGTEPRVGAAAPRKYGNHVVYVTAVHSNGTITVSEMNYNWTPYATRTAVKNASDFYYIY